MGKRSYTVTEEHSKFRLRFVFFSHGQKSIVKIIDYDYVGQINGRETFNLALGDYDADSGKIHDDANTLNGDAYLVLNTVLNTIPLFFKHYPNHTLMIRGSDSSSEFLENCKNSCTKNCDSIELCKNYNRRIKIYSGYVSDNYYQLQEDFDFFGSQDGIVEPFERYKRYDIVFIQKKN